MIGRITIGLESEHLLLDCDTLNIRLSLNKLFKLVNDFRVDNLPYKEQFALTVNVVGHQHFLRPYPFDMPHLDIGRVRLTATPVSVGEIPAHFVFKGRIAKNGLENHFVREGGVCVELHNPRMPGNEILDIGAGIVRQRPPGATCVRSKPSKVGFVITPSRNDTGFNQHPPDLCD